MNAKCDLCWCDLTPDPAASTSNNEVDIAHLKAIANSFNGVADGDVIRGG